jgi:phosphoserine phosphatase RsbU/P
MARAQRRKRSAPAKTRAGSSKPPREDEALLRQMRSANEALVVATVRAESLAEEAEQARAVAAASEERFRSLVLASAAIVWRASADGVVTFESDAWMAFTGRVPGEVDWLDAVHPDDRDRVREAWTTAVAGGGAYLCEHRLVRKSGGYAWVVARAVPIRREAAVREWIGTMTDITERIETERAREQFMAILGHDLRSPLASITLSTDALVQLQLQEPYDRLVEEMGKTSRRMSELIRDVMDFARGRLGTGISVNARPCDLGAVCNEILAEVQRANPGRTIALAQRGDLRGEWDRGRLGQLVTNLLGNAVTHGADPILVELTGARNEVRLSVSNHGATIPKRALATLFEPFSRTRSALGGRGEGLGLGLYIVNEIVRAHRGSVTVSSVDDLTTFVVRLPRTRSAS